MNPDVLDIVAFQTNRHVRPFHPQRISASTWAPEGGEWKIIRANGRTMRQAKKRVLAERAKYQARWS